MKISSSSRRTLLLIVTIAFALRVAVIPFLIGDVTNPVRNHWPFGWEEGRIACSIATHQGFSSPLVGNTGPTAWTGPVYPYLLAGLFRIFGVYSTGSAWAILILNSLFSAFTCIPVYFIGERCFGHRSAVWAAAIWAGFPYAVYFSSGYVWGYCLDALMLSLVVWCTYAVEGKTRLESWVGYGLLWGVAALANAVVLSTLPFLFGWLAWRHMRIGARWFSNSAVALLALALVVSPWFIRNYNTFGRFIPFRSTFWVTFWQGNTGDISDVYPFWANPAHNPAEMEAYRRLGEIGYEDSKKQASLDFVRHYPGLYLRLTARRFIFIWTGFWTLRKDYLAGEPFAFPNIAMQSILTLLMLLGAWKAIRGDPQSVLPLLLVLASYPVVYYFTHVGSEYRHPMDPFFVILAAYAIVSRLRSRSLAKASALAGTAGSLDPPSREA